MLTWSVGSGTDPVGAEYMIIDAVPGVPLKDVWSGMTSLQHIECIESIAKLAKELCSLEFAAFGSLYLNTPAKPTGTIPLDKKYRIGPHCAPQIWGYNSVRRTKELQMPTGSQGPYKLFLFDILFPVLNRLRAKSGHILHKSDADC